MGYTFKKISHPSKRRGTPSLTITVGADIKKKSSKAELVLDQLRLFLDKEEPGLVYFLVNLWRAQGKAITYKELREAILAGEISSDYLDQWMQDYTKFVKEHLHPEWIKAMDAASQGIHQKYPEWYFDPMGDGVRSWTEQRAADFVTSSTKTQIQGLRAVVHRAAVLEDINVDTLARAIRPMVGLYYQQSVANMNYFENLIKNGTKPERALDLSVRYAARQHRYRGYLIARTELAFAYNQGSYEGTKQAQAAGYLGEVVKIWSTAADERTCEICGALEGKTIGLDDDFDFNTKLYTPMNLTVKRVPPAHPSCRCTVLYEEVAPPVYR